MTEDYRLRQTEQLQLFPASSHCEDVREKLGLVEQTMQLLGRAHAEALWAELGLPLPKGAQSPRSKRPRIGPAVVNPLHTHMRRFVEACLDPDPLSEVRAEAVYRTYVAWANQQGELVLASSAMGKVLKAIGMQRRRSNHTIYCGVRIHPQPAENPDPSSI